MRQKNKKVLVDIGHPAHVHYFRNFINAMIGNGHSVAVTAREKEVTHQLLDAYNIVYRSRGKGAASLIGKLFYIPVGDAAIFKIASKFKPDIFLSFASPYAAQVSTIIRKPHIVLDDTEIARFGQAMYRPFSNTILTPMCFKKDFGVKHIRFDGFMELAYLHPRYFTPNFKFLNELNLNMGEKFVLIRFVSWRANHDIGQSGLSNESKRAIVEAFSNQYRVFISAESELPYDLEKYRISIQPHHIHHVIAYASLFIGESSTMASEAAVLGTPAIYCDNNGRGYTNEEERYGLVHNFGISSSEQVRAVEKGLELLGDSRTKVRIERNRIEFLKNKIDVTSFLVWFVENYPESFQIMKEMPQYQHRFQIQGI